MADHLKLKDNPATLKLLSSFSAGNEVLVFSGYVDKINAYGKSQKRVLIITDRGLYNVDNSKCKRRIDLQSIAKIVRSATGYQFVLNVPEEYDYLYESSHMADICQIIATNYQAQGGQPMEVKVVDAKDLKPYVMTKKEAKKMNKDIESLRSSMAVMNTKGGEIDRARTNTVTHFSENKEQVELEDFDLLRVLGKGSFGKVMLVRYRKNGAVYAMKVLKKDSVIQRKQLEHTMTERQILQAVQHPFLVGLRYAFQTEAKLYLVLDYLNGGELFFHLKQAKRFSEDRARFYTCEILMAVGHLHSLGIVYRDMKPENLLLDAQGHIHVSDFGLAKQDITDNSSAKTFCGTPEYLAPEVLSGKGHGRAVDWWSLGTLLFEMLSGLPPFYDRNVSNMYKKILNDKLVFPPHFSATAQDLLARLLERSPERRLGSSLKDAEEIKAHAFFKDVKWDDVLNKRIPVPFVPTVRSAEDVGNFDKTFTEEVVRDTMAEPLSNGPREGNLFDGFTFVPESKLK